MILFIVYCIFPVQSYTKSLAAVLLQGSKNFAEKVNGTSNAHVLSERHRKSLYRLLKNVTDF
jgi:hypothetical protein